MLEARQLYLQVVRRWSEVYEDTIGVDEMRRIIIDIQRDLQSRELRAIFATWTPERLTRAINDLEDWDGDPSTAMSIKEAVAAKTGGQSQAQKIREQSAQRVEDIIHNTLQHRTRGRPKGSVNRPKDVIEAEKAEKAANKVFHVARPLDPAKAAWMRDE